MSLYGIERRFTDKRIAAACAEAYGYALEEPGHEFEIRIAVWKSLEIVRKQDNDEPANVLIRYVTWQTLDREEQKKALQLWRRHTMALDVEHVKRGLEEAGLL